MAPETLPLKARTLSRTIIGPSDADRCQAEGRATSVALWPPRSVMLFLATVTSRTQRPVARDEHSTNAAITGTAGVKFPTNVLPDTTTSRGHHSSAATVPESAPPLPPPPPRPSPGGASFSAMLRNTADGAEGRHSMVESRRIRHIVDCASGSICRASKTLSVKCAALATCVATSSAKADCPATMETRLRSMTSDVMGPMFEGNCPMKAKAAKDDDKSRKFAAAAGAVT